MATINAGLYAVSAAAARKLLASPQAAATLQSFRRLSSFGRWCVGTAGEAPYVKCNPSIERTSLS